MQQSESTWWQRNWKWFVPTIVFGSLTLFGGFIVAILLFVTSLMKSSGAYELAMSRVTESPAVEQRLGSPIEAGFFVSGSVDTSGGSGSSDLSIPISGPMGKARVFLKAQRVAGKWEPDHLVVQFQDAHRIDLLQEPEE